MTPNEIKHETKPLEVLLALAETVDEIAINPPQRCRDCIVIHDDGIECAVSISGRTYEVRDILKAHGAKWFKTNKTWVLSVEADKEDWWKAACHIKLLEELIPLARSIKERGIKVVYEIYSKEALASLVKKLDWTVNKPVLDRIAKEMPSAWDSFTEYVWHNCSKAIKDCVDKYITILERKIARASGLGRKEKAELYRQAVTVLGRYTGHLVQMSELYDPFNFTEKERLVAVIKDLLEKCRR